jgi:Holliday junction DNA helicase RuvA
MISYLHGTLKRKTDDRVVVDVGGVGYEVFLPEFVMETMGERAVGTEIELDIYYHVTDRQLRPMLIGFNSEHEKQFFEKFISVEDVGPLKAARAFTLSVSTLAHAIESEDLAVLRGLPGIGDRTARKIVATLKGKVTEELMLGDGRYGIGPGTRQGDPHRPDMRQDAVEILVSLGHRRNEAAEKVSAAFERNAQIESVQDLITEVYRAEP